MGGHNHQPSCAIPPIPDRKPADLPAVTCG
jgi:hypothetical protein